MKTSNRGNVDPFIVMDVMNDAEKLEAKGKKIIHMEVGQPGTSAPHNAKKAVLNSLEKNNLGYTVAVGLPELREKISKLYKDWYKVEIDPNRIIITSGSSGAFVLSFCALFDEGDKIGIAAPGYPSYRQILKAQNLLPISIKTFKKNRYQPIKDDILNKNLSGLLIASPANPTGTMLSYNELKSLIDTCTENNISFISDEIYHGIEYEKKAVSALEISDDCYVINSFSKYFSMTGWRIGWMIVPSNHIRRVERLAQNLFICAPHVSQVAAIAALDSKKELNKNLKEYNKNRILMIKGLKECGFEDIAPPDGAFYIYADISKFSENSLDFVKDLLYTTGVAITPGVDFDENRGNKTIRFSYARSHNDIKEGLIKIKKFMKLKGYIN